MTPQRAIENEARGLVLIGGFWIVVDRAASVIYRWPHLDHFDRMQRMTLVRSAR